MSDNLLHFEISAATEATGVDQPIPTTPMIAKTLFASPTQISVSGSSLETAGVRVDLDRKTLCVTVTDKARKQPLTRICPMSASGDPAGLTFDRGIMENVYGLGEQFRNPGEVNGDWAGSERTPGNKYGNALPAFMGGATGNAQFPVMYAVGPGHANYAVFLDHTYVQDWDFTGTPWKVSTPGKALRFFLILGQDLPALRATYMDLVGHPTVPPRKAFGLWVSEFGYRNWAHMEDKLRTLRANRFPIDGFVLDAYWYGNFISNSDDSPIGRFQWDEQNFPKAHDEIARLEKQEGVGLMTIEQSYVSGNSDSFKELSKRGYFLKTCPTCDPAINDAWWGRGGMIDWSNAAGADFWHDWRRKQVLTDNGITFHWTDLGEPEQYNDDAYYAGTAGISGHGQAEFHNLYNFLWLQSIDRGYERNHETQRHFIMSRSGAPGIQRFGAAMWSGDTGSNMKTLAAHLNCQMHMSMSGMDYFGADIGGFHREGLEADENMNDVYTRWFAHASFFDVPVRPHTDNGSLQQNTPPDRIGDMKSNLANIRLRYELAPYYYSLAHRAYRFGEPVVPPLVYYYQDDEKVRTIADEKLIGHDLLVAVAPHDEETERRVYLPEGSWVNFRTNEYFHSAGEGFGPFSEFENGTFQLPLFARAGAIIPMAYVDDATMNILGRRTDTKVHNELIARVFAGPDKSAFTLFEDDGRTIAYRTGAVAETQITREHVSAGEKVTVEGTQGSYAGAPTSRRVVIEMVMPGKVRSVRLNGTALHVIASRDQFEDAEMGWYQDASGLIRAKTPEIDVAARKTLDFEY